MEWLHDWIVVSKRIVQKYTIEPLNVDRNALKKCRFSGFTHTRMKRGGQSAFRTSRFSTTGRRGSAEGHCIWPISSQQLAPRPDQTLLQPQRRTNRPVYSQPWHPKPEAYHYYFIIIIIIIFNPRKNEGKKKKLETENAEKTTAPGGRPTQSRHVTKQD